VSALRERWTAAWARAWFAPATGAELALCRIGWCALFLGYLWGSSHTTRMESFDPRSADYAPLPVLSLLTWPIGGARALGPDGLRAILLVTQIAGLLSLVGFVTRLALPVFALGGLIVQAWACSFGEFGHDVSLVLIGLVFLGFSPCAAAWSVDAWLARRSGRGIPSWAPIAGAAWPLRAMHVLLVLAYVSAGMSKLLRDPSAWFGGYTLQYYVSFFALRSGSPAGLWLMEKHGLITALAWGIVLFETSFVLTLWLRRWSAVWLFGSLAVHAGAVVFMGVLFPSFPVLCLTVLPWRRGARSAEAVAHAVRRSIGSDVKVPTSLRGRSSG
jgi:hypothetical protein